MGPPPLNDAIKQRMLTTKRRDTAPERTLRSLLHREGLRFRVDRAPLSGMRARADLVFAGLRVAVFVNGCFWHGCPAHATWPKNNAEWWRKKLETNRARDHRVDNALRQANWDVVRIWEHEDAKVAARLITSLIRIRQRARLRDSRTKIRRGRV